MSFRVVFDATQLPKHGAGTATYIVNLVSEVAALPSREFDFFVISTAPNLDLLRQRAPDAYHISVNLVNRPHRLLWEQACLPRVLTRLNADLLHSPHYTLPIVGRVRRVVTCHDLTYVLMPWLHSRLRRWYFRRMIPVALRIADRVICVSHQTRRDLHRLYPDIPEDRTSVVPHGVDPSYFRPVPPEAIAGVRRRYQLPERYVLHVGTIEPRKNIRRALEAGELLRARGIDASLVLVGQQGWESASLYSVFSTSRACHVLGYVPPEDLAAIYAGADALVMPSHYEGFGLPVLEAMAMRVPVVYSGRGALFEVGGEIAITPSVDSAEGYAAALEAAVTPGPERDERVWRGRAWAEQFTWRRAAEMTAAIYSKVLQTRDRLRSSAPSAR